MSAMAISLLYSIRTFCLNTFINYDTKIMSLTINVCSHSNLSKHSCISLRRMAYVTEN